MPNRVDYRLTPRGRKALATHVHPSTAREGQWFDYEVTQKGR